MELYITNSFHWVVNKVLMRHGAFIPQNPKYRVIFQKKTYDRANSRCLGANRLSVILYSKDKCARARSVSEKIKISRHS